MAHEDAALSRVPLSLRLPAAVVESVASYAKEHRVSKTDAFLHFLHKGIASEEPTALEGQLEEIKGELEQIKKMIAAESFAVDSEQGAVREVVSRVAAEYPAIKQAYLFGSFARGDHTDQSDVDVRIEVDRTVPFSLHDLARFQKAVERGTGREVDVVSAGKLKNERLAAAIEREKVLVYERQE